MITQKLKNISIALLFLSTVFFSDADTKSACRKKIICADTVKAKTICADELIVKTGCCASYTITAKDFTAEDGSLSKTFVIQSPGKYTLGENIAFTPADDAFQQPAIQILSSDIKLDLCSNTLSQANGIEDVYGVLIGYGYSIFDDPNLDPSLHFDNITITNGSITNFTGVGIFCYNPTFDFLEEPFPFNSFNFTTVSVLDCGVNPSFNYASSGINLDSAAIDTVLGNPSVEAFNNVIIDSCKVNRTLGNASIRIYIGNNCVIQNTQANDLHTNTEVGFKCFNYYLECNNLQMFNCQGNGANHNAPANNSGFVGGLAITACENVYVKDCQFNDFFGEGTEFVGNNVSLCTNSVFENCQFNNARGGAGAIYVAGVVTTDITNQVIATQGMRYINCQFNGARIAENNTSDSRIYGMSIITLQDIILDNCQACNIITENPNTDAYGFELLTYPADPIFPIANVQNCTYRNCVISDITGGKEVMGFHIGATNVNNTGNQGSQLNIVIENCIVERMRSFSSTERTAGIAECLYYISTAQFPQARNLLVQNCRVSDVRSVGQTVSPLSAGILVESVLFPTIINNSVSDCDRGILLSGTNQVTPNGFQVAATKEDALAFPPVFIPLDVQLAVTTDPALPGSPFPAVLASYSPSFTAPVSGKGENADPINACTTLTNDLTGKVGVCRRGGCVFTVKTTNVENAGAVGTIVVQTAGAPTVMGGAPTGTGPSVMISRADGDVLINAISSNPPDTFTLTIDTLPSSGVTQQFINTTQNNSVAVNASQVSSLDFILPTTDLTALGWQSGDSIFYDCNGGDAIPELVCSTTYYAIVYRPGYAESGVIQNNTVDNCSISGYQDNRELLDGTPQTSSAWVNNFAFNCGVPASADANYDIPWAGTAPVYAGDLSDYPTGSAKAYNVSLVP